MDVIVHGTVQDGRVVPDAPLPEGVRVEVRVMGPPPQVPPELRAEFEAWERASDRALELAERPAVEGDADAAR